MGWCDLCQGPWCQLDQAYFPGSSQDVRGDDKQVTGESDLDNDGRFGPVVLRAQPQAPAEGVFPEPVAIASDVQSNMNALRDALEERAFRTD